MEDVQHLAADPSPVRRIEMANKLAKDFNQTFLTPAELNHAKEIFRIMVHDAEVRVREALSANLKACPLLPRDVALALAKDIDDSVAVPMLEFSDVLTSEDLVEIVHSQNPSKHRAIARRRTVHADVADALIENGNEQTVAQLLKNPGAHLTEKTLHRVVDRFSGSETVHGNMIHRPVLPMTVAERLVTLVADNLRGELLSRHKISPDVAADLVLQSRERVTANLAMGAGDAEVAALVQQLAENRRLTPSLVLRAVCMGNVKFFEHALARLSGLPLSNSRMLIHDPGKRGLQTMCERADLPESFQPAFQAALSVVEETDFDGQPGDAERYSRRIIERILTQYEDRGLDLESDDLEYLLAKLGQFAAQPSHAN